MTGPVKKKTKRNMEVRREEVIVPKSSLYGLENGMRVKSRRVRKIQGKIGRGLSVSEILEKHSANKDFEAILSFARLVDLPPVSSAADTDHSGSSLTSSDDLRYTELIENKQKKLEQNLNLREKANKQRSIRLSEALLRAIKEEAQKKGVSQQEWMRLQFMKGVAGESSTAEPTGKSSPRMPVFGGLSSSGRLKKNPVALRLEPELEAEVDAAVNQSGFKKNDWIRAALVKALLEGLDVQVTLEPSVNDQPTSSLGE